MLCCALTCTQDPFGVDSNDLPLLSMHDELNCRLERLLHVRPPDADFGI